MHTFPFFRAHHMAFKSYGIFSPRKGMGQRPMSLEQTSSARERETAKAENALNVWIGRSRAFDLRSRKHEQQGHFVRSLFYKFATRFTQRAANVIQYGKAVPGPDAMPRVYKGLPQKSAAHRDGRVRLPRSSRR